MTFTTTTTTTTTTIYTSFYSYNHHHHYNYYYYYYYYYLHQLRIPTVPSQIDGQSGQFQSEHIAREVDEELLDQWDGFGVGEHGFATVIDGQVVPEGKEEEGGGRGEGRKEGGGKGEWIW